jgi:hypothetical protein
LAHYFRFLKQVLTDVKPKFAKERKPHIEFPLPIRFVPSKKNFGWTDFSTKSADTSISSSNSGANGGATASLRVPIDHAVRGNQRHALLAVATAVSGRGIVGRGFVTLLRMEDAVKLNSVGHYSTTSGASVPRGFLCRTLQSECLVMLLFFLAAAAMLETL